MHNSTSCGIVSRRVCCSRFTSQRFGTGNLCNVLSLMKYNMTVSFAEFRVVALAFICRSQLTFFAGLCVKKRKLLSRIFALTMAAPDLFLTMLGNPHGDRKILPTIIANVVIDWHRDLLRAGEKIIIHRGRTSTGTKNNPGSKQKNLTGTLWPLFPPSLNHRAPSLQGRGLLLAAMRFEGYQRNGEGREPSPHQVRQGFHWLGLQCPWSIIMFPLCRLAVEPT